MKLYFPTPLSCDGFTIKEIFDARGYVMFRSGDEIVLLIHSDEKGNISDIARAMAGSPVVPSVVCCCYPVAARQCNPDIPVVGDWEGSSTVEAFIDCIEVYPSPE